MTRLPRSEEGPGRSESGVTLVELLVTSVIMTMIIGAIATSFITAFNSSGPTSERVRESNDAQLIGGYLVRDAQSAGGSNPSTASLDPGIGVSTSDPAGCLINTATYPNAQLELRFKWYDRTAQRTFDNQVFVNGHVANYYFVPPPAGTTAGKIVRTTCTANGAVSTLVFGSAVSVALGNHIASATSACSPACNAGGPLPDSVSMAITATNDPRNAASAYWYKLTATVRPQNGQTPPCTDADVGCTNPTAVIPLLALGGGDCSTGQQVGVDIAGNGALRVFGSVYVNTVPGCPAVTVGGNGNYQAGPTSVLAGGAGCSLPAGQTCATYGSAIPDPFAGLTPPADTCGTGSNPAATVVGATTHYHPGTYPTALSINGGTIVFDPGTYVFCNGVSMSNGTTTGTGVLFYIKGGTLTISGQASVNISAPTTGPYPGMVVWQAAADTTSPLSISGQGTIVIHGTVYAPSAQVNVSGLGTTPSVTAIVAMGVTIGGNGGATVGTPPPFPISITGPASLPAWTVNHVYPNTTMTATGGLGAYTWSATGLPAGLSINSATGVISGTPTTVGSPSVTVKVTDPLGDIDTRTYTVNVNAAPSISGPASLTDWTINRDYPGTAIIASGGTTPYAWSATGLPPGLSINAATGVVSSTSGTGPTATGTFTPTITLTDKTGATDTRGYSITINSPPSITGPASLPTWTKGQVYPNQTMTRTNGTSPFTWAASGLPTGLAINAGTGVISGTPNAAGTFSVSVTITDKAGASATRNYSVTINAVPGIATASLPNAEVGKNYNFTVQPTAGGTQPYTWSLPLHPAWLTIDANTGTFSGIPPATGAPNVTVKITDSTGATAQTTYTLTIAAAVQISGPASMPNWTINRDYPGTAIIVTGGVAPFTWLATGLPPGLSLNPNTGVITGTPSATGTYTITVTVSDAWGVTDPQTYTVTINPSPSITTASLPGGERTVPYSKTLAATNGTTPYTWAASGLPGGLSINSSTGVLSGTPTVSGTFSITFTVTDIAGASVSKNLNLNLSPAPSIDAGTLTDWTAGVAYPNTQLTGSSGTAPYTWSAIGLPNGLTIGLNTGIISGTPTTPGTFSSIVVTMTDALGATATQNYSVRIYAAPSITTSSLPSWTVGIPYPSTTVNGSGGMPSLSWSATGLPTGLSIDAASGVITGTPTATGTYSSAAITLTDAAGATATRTYSITINPGPVVITTTSLPDGERSVAYNATLAASGGTMPYTWSSTALPAGLSLNASSGVISGTATVTGTFSVTVTVTETAGTTANKTLSITLYPQMSITGPASLPAWTVNRPYPSTTVNASGGTGTYSWSATGLPAGMSINSSTGAISGTPTVTGSPTVTVTVTDTASPAASVSRAYTLTIHAAPSITTTSPCDVKKSKAFSFSLAATGGTGTLTWSSPGFPAWNITVSSAGVVSGDAPGSGSATFNVTVTDSTGASATLSLTLNAANGQTC